MKYGRVLLPVLFPLFLLGTWQIAVEVGWWPRTLIATPLDVLKDFFVLLSSGELLAHSRVSLVRLVEGFFLGSIAAVLIGSMVGLSKTVERLLAPTFQALSPIPPPAWIPVLIILFGIEELSKVALIAIGAFIIVYVNTFQGFRSTDQKLVELAMTFQKSKRELTLSVLLPSALPSIMTGMRIALGLSWILLIASELISSKMVSEATRMEGIGLGWLIYDARRFGRPDDMIVGMISMGILGKATDMLTEYFEKRLLRWRQVFQGA